jgi:hypothetical protein
MAQTCRALLEMPKLNSSAVRSVDPYDPWLALRIGIMRMGDPKNPLSAASQNPYWSGKINNQPGLTRQQAMLGMTRYGAEQVASAARAFADMDQMARHRQIRWLTRGRQVCGPHTARARLLHRSAPGDRAQLGHLHYGRRPDGVLAQGLASVHQSV